ncbi:Six-hairpin glycosidase-like protein [Aspergillus carlsbadensis]|nr:Six-hairpin glycosidase-like protein [Aspergillus carlsbadensis]
MHLKVIDYFEEFSPTKITVVNQGKKEIQSFIEREIRTSDCRRNSCIDRRPDLERRFLDTLVDRAGAMFRWAELQLDLFNAKRPIRHWRDFEAKLSKLESDPSLPTLTQAPYILDVCSNFILVDGSESVSLAHLSVREYLEQKETLDTGSSLGRCGGSARVFAFGETCLIAVLHSTLGERHDDGQAQMSFLAYAVAFWAAHCERIPEKRRNGALSLMMTEAMSSRVTELAAFVREMDYGFVMSERERDRLYHITLCDPDEYYQVTPLQLASQYGHADLVARILATAPDDDVQASRGPSLEDACRYGHIEIAQLLIAAVPTDLLLAPHGSPLQVACEHGHLEIVKLLIRAGAEINSFDKRGNSPLRAASWGGELEVVEYLLDHGADASFKAKGARVTASDGTLIITRATTVDVFLDVETNYRYPTQEKIDSEIQRKLSSALKKGYDRVEQEALKDSSSLLNRASINLGQSSDETRTLPTDERILRARSGIEDDSELVTLTWNYGRHMLVASSRNTAESIDLPANLQGIWNNKTSAAWGGKYTININTEMNYWPAGQTNIIETQEPLFDLFKVAHPRAAALERDMYNCSGVVIHHNLDLWGDPAPVDNYTSSSMWPMGAAWLVTHLIDHYRFTGDKQLLSETVYPYLVDVTRFYQCYTFEHNGYRVTGPSLSPENTFYVPDNWTIAGAEAAMDIEIQMDNQLMYEVFHNLLEAAAELGIPSRDKTVAAARSFLAQIHSPRIGSKGQIQEWRLDYDLRAHGHRHLSPLYGLHPGTQFSPLVNATLATAAEILLDERADGGSGSTGWSNAWFINQYARLHRGSDAWAQITKWFSLYPTRNLWNTDKGATFQIDGNFGLVSGVTEMLLQSTSQSLAADEIVHLLPALPDEVPGGNATGLLARGGFEIDVEWESGKLKRAVVRSKLGRKLQVRVADGEQIKVNNQVHRGPIRTKKGGVYVVTLDG